MFENIAESNLEKGTQKTDYVFSQDKTGADASIKEDKKAKKAAPAKKDGKDKSPEEENPKSFAFETSVLKPQRDLLADCLSRYADVYVYDDPDNFGRRERITNSLIKADQTVLGNRIKERLNHVVNSFAKIDPESVCIIGGDFDIKKLHFLRANCGFFKKTWILGQMGLLFHRALKNDPTLPSLVIEPISKIFDIYREEKDSSLCLPLDFTYMPADCEFEKHESQANNLETEEGLKSNRAGQDKGGKQPAPAKSKKPEEVTPQTNNSIVAFLMNL